MTTTNDNIDALRSYQSHGFRPCRIRSGTVDEARLRKPAIPLIGYHGIPLHDEIDLSLDFGGASSFHPKADSSHDAEDVRFSYVRAPLGVATKHGASPFVRLSFDHKWFAEKLGFR